MISSLSLTSLRSLRLFPRGSLYSRLARSFLVLVGILTAVEIYVFYSFWKIYQETTLQQLSWDLAADFAKEYEPLLRNFDPVQAQKDLFRLSRLTPGVDPYLLDEQGSVVVHLAPYEEGPVSVADLRAFLDHRGPVKNPIRIRYPATSHPDLREKIFSVAPIRYGEKAGYLFLGLEGSRRELMDGAFGDSYLFRFSLVVAALAVLGTTLLGLLVFRLLTKNFHSLSQAMELVESGKFDVRVKVQGDDEVSRAGKAFNSMVDTLVSTLERVRKVDAQRRELLGNVTHDIRRPITSTQLKLQTFLHAPKGPLDPQDRQNLEGILKGFQGVQNLIDDLFELSKLDAAEIAPKKENIPLQQLLDEVLDELDPLSVGSKVDIEILGVKSENAIRTDRELFHRLLSNLVENAILYSPENSIVRIVLEEMSRTFRLSVVDQGIGIGADELPHIFERFYRSSAARDKSSGGTGLGLAICQRISETLGMRLGVESVVQKGSTFYLEIPLSVP